MLKIFCMSEIHAQNEKNHTSVHHYQQKALDFPTKTHLPILDENTREYLCSSTSSSERHRSKLAITNTFVSVGSCHSNITLRNSLSNPEMSFIGNGQKDALLEAFYAAGDRAPERSRTDWRCLTPFCRRQPEGGRCRHRRHCYRHPCFLSRCPLRYSIQ